MPGWPESLKTEPWDDQSNLLQAESDEFLQCFDIAGRVKEWHPVFKKLLLIPKGSFPKHVEEEH